MIIIGIMLLGMILFAIVWLLSLMGIFGWIFLVMLFAIVSMLWFDIKIIRALILKVIEKFTKKA